MATILFKSKNLRKLKETKEELEETEDELEEKIEKEKKIIFSRISGRIFGIRQNYWPDIRY